MNSTDGVWYVRIDREDAPHRTIDEPLSERRANDLAAAYNELSKRRDLGFSAVPSPHFASHVDSKT